MESFIAIVFDFLIFGTGVMGLTLTGFVFKKQLKAHLQDFLDIKTDKIRGIKDGTSNK